MTTILLVEDDVAVREVLHTVLERDAFTIVEADTGEEAMERLREARPDLVVLDLMLPGMDGLEVLRRLRAAEETARLPVVVVSARGTGGRQDALSAGADAYLAKPFSPLELLRAVEAGLEAQASPGAG
jgi:CheY-like chemotaxis protein